MLQLFFFLTPSLNIPYSEPRIKIINHSSPLQFSVLQLKVFQWVWMIPKLQLELSVSNLPVWCLSLGLVNILVRHFVCLACVRSSEILQEGPPPPLSSSGSQPYTSRAILTRYELEVYVYVRSICNSSRMFQPKCQIWKNMKTIFSLILIKNFNFGHKPSIIFQYIR